MDYERNGRHIYLLLLTYHLFEYIEDEEDYNAALDMIAYNWSKISKGEKKRPQELPGRC